MSEEESEPSSEGFQGLKRSTVSSEGREISTACAKQLGELLGCEITARAPDVQPVQKGAVADSDTPLLHQLCKTSGENSLPVHILASRETSGTLAGLQLGKEDDALDSFRKEELDGDGREAFQNLMAAVTGPIASALADAGLPEIEVRDAREVPEPASDPTWLDGDDFIRLRLELTIEDQPNLRLDVLLPRSPSDEAEKTDDTHVVFIESCPDEFDRLEEIASEVAFEVSVVQPANFLEDLEDGTDATAIVVPWEVVGRSGLELVENLIGREELENAIFAMSSEFPRRNQIAAARRAGARSFLRRPYEREEIERRLLAAPDAAGEQNGGNADTEAPEGTAEAARGDAADAAEESDSDES